MCTTLIALFCCCVDVQANSCCVVELALTKTPLMMISWRGKQSTSAMACGPLRR